MTNDQLAQEARREILGLKDELAEMEEGQQRTQYIVEDAGNPTLVNRMASEWNRVDGMGDGASPQRKAFARDFRKAHSNPMMEPVGANAVARERQGKLGHSPWRF